LNGRTILLFLKSHKNKSSDFFAKNSIDNFFMLDHLSIVEQLNYASERIENKKTLKKFET
jgi:hypothetical protein